MPCPKIDLMKTRTARIGPFSETVFSGGTTSTHSVMLVPRDQRVSCDARLNRGWFQYGKQIAKRNAEGIGISFHFPEHDCFLMLLGGRESLGSRAGNEAHRQSGDLGGYVGLVNAAS